MVHFYPEFVQPFTFFRQKWRYYQSQKVYYNSNSLMCSLHYYDKKMTDENLKRLSRAYEHVPNEPKVTQEPSILM